MPCTLERRAFLARTAQATLAIGAIHTAHAVPSPAATGNASGVNATPREICEAYWRAEASRNLEKTLQYFHHDAVYVAAGKRLTGLEEIKGFYVENFRSFPGLEVHLAHEISKGNEASFEWQAVLIDPSGTRHPAIGVNVVRVEDGRFREMRAYFDPTILKG
jgi:hypothetical protein